MERTGKELVSRQEEETATHIPQSPEGVLCATAVTAPPSPHSAPRTRAWKPKVEGTVRSPQVEGVRVEEKASLDYWIRDKEWARPEDLPLWETP